MESRTSSNSSLIRLLASELPALEHQKGCCGNDSEFSFDRTIFKLADKKTGVKSCTSLILSQIKLFALKLLALSTENFSH